MSTSLRRTLLALSKPKALGFPADAPPKGAVAAFERGAKIKFPDAFRQFMTLHDGWLGLGSAALFSLDDQKAWRARMLGIDATFTGHPIGIDRSLGGILCLELSLVEDDDAPVVCIGESGADIAFESFTAMLEAALLARNMTVQPAKKGAAKAKAKPVKRAPTKGALGRSVAKKAAATKKVPSKTATKTASKRKSDAGRKRKSARR